MQLAFGGPGRLTAAVRDAAWYPLGLPRRARRAGIDVLHCPTFRAPFQPPVPLVVTVFDLAILRYPEAFNRWTRTYSRFFVPRAVRAAARVITISDFTKREVTELLGMPEDRIRVIPLAAGEAFGAEGAAAAGDYVLAVGTLEPRKNLARLAEGARRAGLELRVVGARGWGGVQADGAGVRWLGHVPDAELAELYRGALCVAYPSLYEGFGLPVLEAMACGAPVVTSRGSATEEVADGAAVLVDAADPASIAAGLEEAIGRRDELGRLGRERAAGFSWDRVAEQTVRRLPGAGVSALVLIDADVLGRERTGEETYVANLLRELPALTDELAFVAVTRHPELIPEGVEAIHLPARSQELRMAWTLPRLMRRARSDLAHFQHAIPLRCPCPAVVTVHDLSFEREPKLLGPKDRFVFRRVVPRAARNAVRLIAVSERTKADLVELYDIPPERITVAHHGIDPTFVPAKSARTSQPSTTLKGAWHR